MRRRWLPIAILVAVAVMVAVAVIEPLIWERQRAREHESAHETGSAGGLRVGARPPAEPASISGHVTKQGGGAIAGAVVAIGRANFDPLSSKTSDEGATTVVVADAQGAWTASQIAPGTYVVAASAPGFLPARHDRFVLAAGEHREGIDVVLAPGGTVVHGTVSDVGGGGIPGARVAASLDNFDIGKAFSQGEAPFTTLSGADGKYELSLPDGPYQLGASHDDYTNRSKSIHVAGKPLVIDFSLVPGAVIRGQVVAHDSGKPVPGAIVSSKGGGRRMQVHGSSATADAEGKFVMRHLSSGTIALSAFADGYVSNTPTEVSVGIGEQVDGIRVVVDHALSISGRVVDKGTQTGIAGVMVGGGSLAGGGEARSLEPSDKNGEFRIVGVKPASYILFAISEDKMPEIGKNVDVTDKDVTGVVLEMSAGATLSGRVDPPGKASISLSLNGDIGIGNIMEVMRSAFAHADADATGVFVMQHVPAGKFTLAATTDEGPAGSIPVTVTEVNQKDLVIALETRASISGHVLDTNHAPVAGLRVSANRVDDEKGFNMAKVMAMARGGATSGDDGSFRIVGLEAGKYTVSAREDDFMSFGGGSKKDKKPDDAIELAAGATRTGVVVTVEAKDGVIRGVVIGSDGKPAADAWVSGRVERDKEASAKLGEFASMFGTTAPVLTNADGKFVLDRLRKGTYTLVADGPRGGSRGEKSGVSTGDTATITLAPLGTLSGHVTSRAAPVAAYDLLCRGPAGRVDRHVEAADGAYHLEHLVPGHYDCDASADAGTATGASEVPTGAATLELQLVPWASLVGTVVNVLTGAPLASITPIVSTRGDDGRGMAKAIFGNGPVTDATGRFTIDRVGAGSGSVQLFSKTDIMKPLATKPFTATQGEQVDLGTIKVIPPRNGDAGTLGMTTEAKGDALEVTAVVPGGPAAAAGVVVGDKITSLDGKAISDLTPDIAQKILSSGVIASGMQIVLGLERGATLTLTAAKW